MTELCDSYLDRSVAKKPRIENIGARVARRQCFVIATKHGSVLALFLCFYQPSVICFDIDDVGVLILEEHRGESGMSKSKSTDPTPGAAGRPQTSSGSRMRSRAFIRVEAIIIPRPDQETETDKTRCLCLSLIDKAVYILPITAQAVTVHRVENLCK